MLRLDYDPIVLKALEQAFKPKIAKRQLDRYLRLLQSVMRRSMVGRSRFAQLKKAYEFPLKKLWNGPQIGDKRIRVHQWLNDNNLALVKNINPNANNLSQERSLLRPTPLLIITEVDDLVMLRRMSPIELDYYLDTVTNDWRQDVHDELEEYVKAPPHVQATDYDTTYIDIQSLKNFIKKLVKKQLGLNFEQEGTSFYQAEFILRIAQVNNCELPQKREPKLFGRTYYEGYFTVQSVSKKLRAAMLGTSWEYDCKSCSTAWKMAFSTEWFNQKKRPRGTVREKFSAMTMYLERKEHFFNQVIKTVFANDPQRPHDVKKDMVKQAMTALGFGAKLSLGKWRSDGKDQITSLYSVFEKDMNLLKRYVDCPLVKKFNAEQQLLNKFILNRFTVDRQWHADMAIAEREKGVRFNQSQKIVWLFQHAETIMMDIVRYELKKLKSAVLANVHDAIVIRERLTFAQREKIELMVRKKTGVQYFSLSEAEY